MSQMKFDPRLLAKSMRDLQEAKTKEGYGSEKKVGAAAAGGAAIGAGAFGARTALRARKIGRIAGQQAGAPGFSFAQRAGASARADIGAAKGAAKKAGAAAAGIPAAIKKVTGPARGRLGKLAGKGRMAVTPMAGGRAGSAAKPGLFKKAGGAVGRGAGTVAALGKRAGAAVAGAPGAVKKATGPARGRFGKKLGLARAKVTPFSGGRSAPTKAPGLLKRAGGAVAAGAKKVIGAPGAAFAATGPTRGRLGKLAGKGRMAVTSMSGGRSGAARAARAPSAFMKGAKALQTKGGKAALIGLGAAGAGAAIASKISKPKKRFAFA